MRHMTIRIATALACTYGMAVPAYALVSCESNKATVTFSDISGASSLSVPPDVPVGTRIYQARVRSDQFAPYDYVCSGSAGEPYRMSLIGVAKNGRVLSDGKTFDSGYPGIGVQYWINGDYIKNPERVITDYDTKMSVDGKDLLGQYMTNREISIFLVKTGDVKPGVITTRSFPNVVYSWRPGGNTSVSGDGIFANFIFDGTINITTPTCQTPERVDVDLGTYTSSQITANGSSPWKDSSIRLSGCPRFTGYVKTQGTFDITHSGGNLLSYTDKPVNGSNKVGITLNGVQGNLNMANGIVGIARGASAAEGVAIQIASGTTGSNTPMRLGVESFQEIPTDGASTVNIPLVVRMVRQGQSTVKAGRVESQITYLINYK